MSISSARGQGQFLSRGIMGYHCYEWLLKCCKMMCVIIQTMRYRCHATMLSLSARYSCVYSLLFHSKVKGLWYMCQKQAPINWHQNLAPISGTGFCSVMHLEEKSGEFVAVAAILWGSWVLTHCLAVWGSRCARPPPPLFSAMLLYMACKCCNP